MIWVKGILVWAFAALSVLFFSCTESRIVSGGASETTNGIIASVVYPKGAPCVHGIVKLRTSDYLEPIPGTSPGVQGFKIDSITDSRGHFHLTGAKAGAYVVEVIDTLNNALAVSFTVADSDSVVDLGVDTLRPAGAVKGALAESPIAGLYVRAKGLEFIAEVNPESRSLSQGGLPHGIFSMSMVYGQNMVPIADFGNVSISSGDTTDLGSISLWKHSKRIVLNTSNTGAGVSSATINFPVLVRMTSTDFDFSQFLWDGSGIQFSRPAGAILPYEVERWDSAAAELWVRVDTVFGNNDTQYITMKWGNPTVSAAGDTLAVFDTAQGFQGVWHMNEPGGASCLDATQNHFNGTPFNMTSSSATAGAIGSAQQFDGASSYIQMVGTAQGRLDFGENGVYSISAWVYADTVDQLPHLVASKGHEQYYLKMMTNDSLKTLTWENVEYHGNVGWQITECPATQKAWKYLVGVRSGAGQRLYVDGVLVDSIPRVIAGAIPRNTSEDFSIGAYLRNITYLTAEGYCYFGGIIDEVRICNVASSADWIKLCYVNQKTPDGLVTFR